MARESPGKQVPILNVICAPVMGQTCDTPRSHPPIDGWSEWRKVRDVIVQLRNVPLKIVRLHPPTLDRLRRALQPELEQPSFPMVHIIGYVAQDKLLRMERDNGQEDPVSPAQLAEAFARAGVRIALLTICSGEAYAEALITKAGAGAALTTRSGISDPEAKLVAREVYLKLARRDAIGQAFDSARKAIVEGYRVGALPPLDDFHGGDLVQYGRGRADNLVLVGDPYARLPLPANGLPPGPAFDLSEPPHNLVHPDDIFVGRGRELLHISDWMDEHQFRVIALTNIGGIGKSSLAIMAALRNSWRFRAIIYCTAKDRSGRRRPITVEEICGHVEVLMGLDQSLADPANLEARRQRAADVVSAGPCLLVLDNLESLTKQEAEELGEFLFRIDPRQGAMALVTLRPEHLPPLVDNMRRQYYHLHVDGLEPTDAVAFLYELVKLPATRAPTSEELTVWQKVSMPPAGWSPETMPNRQLRRGETDWQPPPALTELAEAVHQHPLLLQFAVAELKQPQNNFDDVLGRMRGLKGKDLQEEAQDWIGVTCDNLAEHEPHGLTLLEALLLFSGGATPDALRFVWRGEHQDLPANNVHGFENAVGAARRAALLGLKSGRFDLHPLVRQYVSQRERVQARSHWRAAFAAYFWQYAQRYRHDFAKLEEERANLFTAMDWANDSGNDRIVIEFALLLFDFLLARGFWSEGRKRTTRGIAAARKIGDRKTEAALLYQCGVLGRHQADFQGALSDLDQSRRLAEELEDKPLKSRTLLELGIVHKYVGSHSWARQHYRLSLDLARELGDRVIEAITYHELGVLDNLLDKYQNAQHYLETSLVISRDLSDRSLQASTLHQLSLLLEKQERPEEARPCCQEALGMALELDNKVLQARCLTELADLYVDLGNYEEALQLYEQSSEVKRRLGDRVGLVATLVLWSRLNRLRGATGEAKKQLEEGRDLAVQVGSRFWEGWAWHELGLCAQLDAEHKAAEDCFQRAREIAGTHSYRKLLASSLCGLGESASIEGRSAEAGAFLEQARAIAEELRIPSLIERIRKALRPPES